MIGLPAMSFLVMAFWPSSLQLYFTFTGLFGLAQVYLINSPPVRRLLNLTPLPSSPTGKPSGMEPPRLRLIEELRKAQEEQPPIGPRELPADLSRFDRWKASFMDPFKKAGREVKDTVNKWNGEGTGENSAAVPPRLSKPDLKRAEDYEKNRQQEEALKRTERNERLLEQAKREIEKRKQKRPKTRKSPTAN
jgi:YidC/Oxa1 family membrane protein insertase